jgi:hypothetical protein
VREKDQTKLRRFFEALSSGRSTGRIAYVTAIAAMPQAVDGAKWKEDAAFIAAEAILDDPHLKQIYATAIKDGCAIVDRT